MIPLAQYLNERDGDGGFQSFAPKRQTRGGKRPGDFSAVGNDRAVQQTRPETFEGFAGSEDGVDTAELFKEMESELRSRAAPQQPTKDARALQDDLRSKASRLNASKALEAARKAAYDEGRSEALAEAEADREAAIEAAVEEERTAAEERQKSAIEAARAEWAEAEGERLAAALADQTARLSEAMRKTLSSILKPLAINTRQRQSIDELVQSIGMLSFDGKAISVKASGPADLLDRLETALGDRAAHVTFHPSDDRSEVKIEIGQTVLQSRLGEWRSALETALS
ncbi:flagellar motor protein [Fulvimarina pelagi HTCC2506]|uniref:Flagellar motor protein n=1 Tax=Fulvimarina pelagi HTCC2506 TaxID=314231 RepID=Q0G3Q6_9HYPH|nr:hypothetical protein [Fulvimarina pelagi]EAU41775.1 flagellar motor protein [Fulvimarina pelagi HTCC2506]